MYINTRQPLKDFQSNQRIVCGSESSLRILSGLKQSRGILLVSQRIMSIPLLKAQLDEMVADGWELLLAQSGEPKLEYLVQNLAKYSSFRYKNVLIAVGGGSVIDEAKFISLALNAPEFLDQFNSSRRIRSPKSLKTTSIVAVPTTLGSGSESSSAGLMTNSHGEKVVLSGPEVLPALAILDPLLISDTPVKILAQSTLDAIAHSIEGFLSKIENPGAAFQAKTALSSLLNLSNEVSTASIEQVAELQIAGNLAGQVQDKMLVGPAHVIAHYFSNIPHGIGAGYFLKITCMYYRIFEAETYRKLELILDSVGYSFEKFIETLDSLLDLAIGNSKFLSELALPVLDSLRNDVAGLASPVPIDQELLDRMWKIHEQTQH